MTTEGSLYTSVNAYINSNSSVFTNIDDNFCPQILNVSDNSIADYHPRNFSFEVPSVNMAGESSSRRRAFIMPQPGGIDTSSTLIDDIYPQLIRDGIGGAHSALNNTLMPVRSAGRSEAKTVKMTTTGTVTSPEVVNWRETLRTKIAAKLNSGTISGVDGFLFDVTVEPAAGLTTVKPNYTINSGSGPEPSAFMLMKNHPRDYSEIIESTDGINPAEGLPEITGRVANTAGFTGYSPVKTEISRAMDETRLVPREAYNLDDANGGEPIRCQVSTDFTEAGGHIVNTPVATAWVYLGNVDPTDGFFSTGENYVVFESAFGIASGDQQDIGILTEDGELLAVLKLEDETSVTVDGFTGVRYFISGVQKYQDVTTVADFAGQPRFTFKPTIVPQESGIGELILKLLCSVNGAGTTSSEYDDFIIGAGMSDGTGSHGDDFGADINVDSFLAIPDPAGSEVYAPIYQDGDTLLDAIDGLLAATGYTVDIRSDDQGRCQLTAVEVSLPNRSVVTKAINESQIADSPTPQSVAEISIKNVFNFSANFNSEGDPGVELTIKDQVSIDLFNEAEEVDIELKGINLDLETPGDAVSALRAMFGRLRVENSYPRRVFRFDAPVGVLQRLTLGDTVAITHQLLRAQKGLGVTNEPARVRSIEYSGYEAVGTIEAVSYGTVGESWNVTAGITTVVNSTTFVVSEEVHSPARHPATGDDIEELTGFSVGDYVDIYDVYDMDSPTTVKITAISTSTNAVQVNTALTFTADSLGLGFRGFMTSRVEASAEDEHADYGFIGSTVTT